MYTFGVCHFVVCILIIIKEREKGSLIVPYNYHMSTFCKAYCILDCI